MHLIGVGLVAVLFPEGADQAFLLELLAKSLGSFYFIIRAHLWVTLNCPGGGREGHSIRKKGSPSTANESKPKESPAQGQVVH